MPPLPRAVELRQVVIAQIGELICQRQQARVLRYLPRLLGLLLLRDLRLGLGFFLRLGRLCFRRRRCRRGFFLLLRNRRRGMHQLRVTGLAGVAAALLQADQLDEGNQHANHQIDQHQGPDDAPVAALRALGIIPLHEGKSAHLASPLRRVTASEMRAKRASVQVAMTFFNSE
jgi:hypothetical protein